MVACSESPRRVTAEESLPLAVWPCNSRMSDQEWFSSTEPGLCSDRWGRR